MERKLEKAQLNRLERVELLKHGGIEASDMLEGHSSLRYSLDREALEVHQAVESYLGRPVVLSDEADNRLLRRAFDCHALVRSADTWDFDTRVEIVALCDHRHRIHTAIQAAEATARDTALTMGELVFTVTQHFDATPTSTLVLGGIGFARQYFDTPLVVQRLTAEHLRFLAGNSDLQPCLETLLVQDWDMAPQAHEWVAQRAFGELLAGHDHLQAQVSTVLGHVLSQEEDLSRVLAIAQSVQGGQLDLQAGVQALEEQLGEIQTSLAERESALQATLAHYAQENTELHAATRTLLEGFGFQQAAFQQETQASVNVIARQFQGYLASIEKARQEAARHQEVKQNIEAISSTGGFLSGLGQVLNCRELTTVGHCVQSVAKITEGVCQLTGVLGSAVSGFAMLGPIGAIGMGVVSLISAFSSSNDGMGKALQAIMEGIQQLGRMLEQLSEQVREGFEMVHLNLVINRIEIQVNRTAILQLSQRLEFLSAELTRDLAQQRRLHAYRHQEITGLLTQLEDNTSPLRQRLDTLFNFSRLTASPSETFGNHFNAMVTELTDLTALSRGVSAPALVGEALNHHACDRVWPDLLRAGASYHFHLNTLRDYVREWLPTLEDLPRPVNLKAAAYVVLQLLKLIKVNHENRVQGVLDEGKVSLLQQARQPVEATLAFQQALWPVAPILIQHLIKGMVDELAEVKRLLSNDPTFSAEAFSKQLEAEINEAARQHFLEAPGYFNPDMLQAFVSQPIKVDEYYYQAFLPLMGGPNFANKTDTELAKLASQTDTLLYTLLHNRSRADGHKGDYNGRLARLKKDRQFYRDQSGKGWLSEPFYGQHLFVERGKGRDFMKFGPDGLDNSSKESFRADYIKPLIKSLKKQKLAVSEGFKNAQRGLKLKQNYNLSTGLSVDLESYPAPLIMLPDERHTIVMPDETSLILPLLPMFPNAVQIIPAEVIKAHLLGLVSVEFSYSIERKYDEDSLIYVYGNYLLNDQWVTFFEAHAAFDAFCFPVGEAAWHGWMGRKPSGPNHPNNPLGFLYLTESPALHPYFLSVCTHEVIPDYGQAELMAAIEAQLDRYQHRFKQHLLEALETASPLSQRLNRAQAHFKLLSVLMETLLPNQTQPLRHVLEQVSAAGIFTIDGLTALLNEEATDYDQLLNRLLSPEQLSLFEQVLQQLLSSIEEAKADTFGALAVNLLSDMLAIYEPGAKAGGVVQPALEDLLLQASQALLAQDNQRIEIDTKTFGERLEQIVHLYKSGHLFNTSDISLLTQGEPNLEPTNSPSVPETAPSETEILANISERLSLEGNECIQRNASLIQQAALSLKVLFHLQDPSTEVRSVEPALEGPGYIRHPVRGDGDCGYTAFGITRQEALRLLTRHREEVDFLLQPAVAEALLETRFYDYVIRQALIEPGITHERVIAEIEEYSSNEDIMHAYLIYDVRDKQVELGWAHPRLLQALAHIRGIALYMWSLDEQEALIPHVVFDQDYSVYQGPHADTRVDLLFVNGNHFDLLEMDQSTEHKRSTSHIDQSPTGQKTSRSDYPFFRQASDNASYLYADSPILSHPTQKNKGESECAPRTIFDGLIFEPIPKDGHCLFHIIALYLGQDERFLRQMVSAHLEANAEDFRAFIQGDFETYVEGIRNGSLWGGHQEIEVIQRITGRPIIILRPDANPNLPDNLEAYDYHENPPIFIHFDGVNHYDGFVLADDADPSEILFRILSAMDQGVSVAYVRDLNKAFDSPRGRFA